MGQVFNSFVTKLAQTHNISREKAIALINRGVDQHGYMDAAFVSEDDEGRQYYNVLDKKTTGSVDTLTMPKGENVA